MGFVVIALSKRMNQPNVETSERGLPDHLAARLEPQLRHALDHPLRREVLRVLNGGERSWSVPEIVGMLSGSGVSSVNYHALVLEQSGCAVVTGTRPVHGGRQSLYASLVAEDARVLSILRATQRRDRQHRQQTGRRASSRFLTMFRVPRPALTIRLGDRRRVG